MAKSSSPFGLRCSTALRDKVRVSADKNGRSMNAEIVHHLQRALDPAIPVAAAYQGSGVPPSRIFDPADDVETNDRGPSALLVAHDLGCTEGVLHAGPPRPDLDLLERSTRIVERVRSIFGATEARAMWRFLDLPDLSKPARATPAHPVLKDEVATFLDECCVRTAVGEIKARDFRAAFLRWSEGRNLAPAPANVLGKLVVALGTPRRKSCGIGVYYGIAFKAGFLPPAKSNAATETDHLFGWKGGHDE